MLKCPNCRSKNINQCRMTTSPIKLDAKYFYNMAINTESNDKIMHIIYAQIEKAAMNGKFSTIINIPCNIMEPILLQKFTILGFIITKYEYNEDTYSINFAPKDLQKIRILNPFNEE